MKMSAKKRLIPALVCVMALAVCAGCSNTSDSAAETEKGDDGNTVVSDENMHLNFSVKVTDARTDGNELSIMYMVSLPENERPASDMEFESIRLMAGAEEADCEFDGAEVYSDNGENAVYTVDYVFDKDVPAGTYGLVLENFGYYEGEAFSAAVGSNEMPSVWAVMSLYCPFVLRRRTYQPFCFWLTWSHTSWLPSVSR